MGVETAWEFICILCVEHARSEDFAGERMVAVHMWDMLRMKAAGLVLAPKVDNIAQC